LALVTELARRGRTVVGLDLGGDERAAAVTAAGATFVACDVSDLEAWAAVASHVRESLGGLDQLFLNAGIMTRSARDPISDDPLDLAGSAGYRRLFAVNVDGVVFGLAAMRPLLSSGASVVVTSSVAGLVGLPFDPYYAMTKHAVVGFVRSMAEPLAADGVRINAICPGGMDTAIVPDELRRAGISMRSAHDSALAVLDVAARDDTGGTWLFGPGDEARKYETPPIRVRLPE
jgi:NAD(P)-dependent dehydrogenase (short-subunit alcohol dehydrogenase family)